MKDATEFIDFCKPLLNKHGINLTRKFKFVLELLYRQKKDIFAEDIASCELPHNKKNVPLQDIKNFLSVLEEEHILKKANNNSYNLTVENRNVTYDNPIDETRVQHLEAFIVQKNKEYENDYNSILDAVQNTFPETKEAMILKNIDAYNLLLNSLKVDDTLKTLLKNVLFIDQNPSIILDLAKLFFQADTMTLIDDKIVIKKEVCLPHIPHEENAPDINEVDLIRRLLQKIKYDRLNESDINKIIELGKYQKYKLLSSILMNAIDSQALIKTLGDQDMIMNMLDLEQFLETE